MKPGLDVLESLTHSLLDFFPALWLICIPQKVLRFHISHAYGVHHQVFVPFLWSSFCYFLEQDQGLIKQKHRCSIIWNFQHNDSRPTLTYFTMSLSSFSRSLHLCFDFFHASSRCFCLKTTSVRILPSLNSILCNPKIFFSFCYLFFRPLLHHRHHAVPLMSVF